jgi:hypothetical protein
MVTTVDKDRFLDSLENEFQGACNKFPGNLCNAAALTEEVGELNQALLQLQFEPAKGKTRADVYKEAIQVAAMAMKIALLGSSEFPAYEYEYECYRAFMPTGSKQYSVGGPG